MKKLSILILSIIMCLSLAACTEKETASSSQDDISVSSAVSALYGAEGSKYADHLMLPAIYGSWEFQKSNAPWEYTLYKNLILNEDGTAIVDGQNANWKIEDDFSNNNNLCIGIYIDNACVYGADFGANFNGMYLLASSGPTKGDLTQTVFINTNTKAVYSSHQVFPVLCGTYKNEELTPKEFTITNNCKCTLDGTNGTWELYPDFTDGHNEPYQLGIAITLENGETYYIKAFENETSTLYGSSKEEIGNYTK